ncbi:MAG: alpha/beta fold hydrolase [Actinomycetota bacterium]|nr:alpha/beta fold hydrolase [Actinomycetota bacterium]
MAIAFERVGEGPPLVLLHPLGADRQVWAPVVEQLRDRRELILIDLPGFGQSQPLPDGKPTARALAQAVVGFLGSIGIDSPHVAGNSLGGWVALEMGLNGATSSTTAISPAGLWPGPLVPKPSAAHKLARALLPLVGPFAASRPGRQLLLGSAVAHPGRVPSAAAAHLVRVYAQASGFVAVNNAMRAGRFESLERIRGPVTLVWPARDRLVNRPSWLPDNVRNVVIADAGHIPMWDQPEKVAELLLAASTVDTRVGARPGSIRA